MRDLYATSLRPVKEQYLEIVRIKTSGTWCSYSSFRSAPFALFFIQPSDLAILTGMTQSIFQVCMADRREPDEDRLGSRWAEAWSHPIAGNIRAVSDLLGQMDKEQELRDDLLGLFSGVLDAMRMNRENREKDAGAIFTLVERWLDANAASGSLDNRQKMALCQAFIRAGLEPPDAIRITSSGTGSEVDMVGLGVPDIETLMGAMIPEDVTGYMVLREGIGAMPLGASALFVTQIIAQAVPKLVSLGRYFLLDPMADMRMAAAEGFVNLAQAGAIDAGVLSDLIRLRKWLPDQATKTILDRAIKEALRRETTGGSIPDAWTVHRLVTSLPDGTGSQSIMASVSRGSRKCIATLLLKADHGIKDAYAIPCTSASDQRRSLTELEDAVPMHEVPKTYLSNALATALGEGLVEGLPPAPGFLEVAEMLGVGDITPVEHGTVSLLEVADPEAQLAGLSATKRGRLMARSLEWARDHEMSSSWFVTDETLSARLAEAKTERQAEKVVWAHLETQRDFWTALFARSAAILRSAGSNDWLTFAAVVQVLESGHTLKRIPIFEMITALTLDVAEQGRVDVLATDENLLDDPSTDGDFDPDIEPEATGELGRLLRKTPLRPDMIDGYLTAVIVAPRFVTPTDWLPPLLAEINFPGGNKLQRVLDIIMLRYGAIQSGLYEGDIASGIRKRSARNFHDWLFGFAQASAITTAWPKRALSKDDQKILRLIKDGAQGDHNQAALKPLLPSWLEAMAAKALDG